MATPYFPLIGRILLALIFVHSGYEKIGGFSKVAAGMAAKGVPFAEANLPLVGDARSGAPNATK